MSNKTQFVLAFPDKRDLRSFVRGCTAEAKAYDAGEAVTKPTVGTDGNLDFYVEGADLEANDLGVYVEGADLEADDLDVYVEGADPEAGDLGVYVEGADLEDFPVYVGSADLEADDLDVYVEGADLEADDLDPIAEEESEVEFEAEETLLAEDEGEAIVTARQPRRCRRMLEVSVICLGVYSDSIKDALTSNPHSSVNLQELECTLDGVYWCTMGRRNGRAN